MKKLVLFISFLVLQACAIAPDAVLKKTTLPGHDLIATDSRLRVIANTEQGIFSGGGLVQPKRIICTEPSPDVATTVANSLGLGVSVMQYGSASLSAAQVEGLVQLGERTAAIQILRDKMYQTCLAYANGAISGTTYSLIMSRLDDSIVTLSLADGAAGAFGRSLAGIGGEAAAKAEAAMITLPSEIAKIEEQASKLAAATKRVDEAEKALKAHEATQPETGKEEAHKTQTIKLEGDLAVAKRERDALLELMRGTAKSASDASAKISQLQTGGRLTATPSAGVLGEMQAAFLASDISRDFISACLVELGLSEEDSDNQFTKLTKHLDDLLMAAPPEQKGPIFGAYSDATIRNRQTKLGKFCQVELKGIIKDAIQKSHEHRLIRVQTRAGALNQATFNDSIRLCTAEFKDDPARRKSCLDKAILIKQPSEQKPLAEAKTPNEINQDDLPKP